MAEVFESQLHLEEVAVPTGEEDENLIYVQQIKLYRFAATTKEWKQRANGEIRFLQHRQTNKIRVVLRDDKVLKVRLNHRIEPSCTLGTNPGSDMFLIWTTRDYSDDDEGESWSFGARFKTAEARDAFRDRWEACANVSLAPKPLSLDPFKEEDPASALEGLDVFTRSLSQATQTRISRHSLRMIWDEHASDGHCDGDGLELVLGSIITKITDKLSPMPTDEDIQKSLEHVPAMAFMCFKLAGKQIGTDTVGWADLERFDLYQHVVDQ